MRFDLSKGNKGREDLILYVETEGYEQITCQDLFTIIKHLFDNEDKIYPPPQFKGSKLLLEAIQFLRSHTIRETLLHFRIEEAQFVTDFMGGS